jgi:hypothetical protein
MNNELLIIDKSGKAYRCVAYRQVVRGEVFLGTGGQWITGGVAENVPIDQLSPERHILEEVPSPYIFREDAEALRLAAETALDTMKYTKHRIDTGLAQNGATAELDGVITETAAALEPFQSPPEVQERWRWEGDSIFDGDTEFNIANVEGCTELVAALNANEQPTGD